MAQKFDKTYSAKNPYKHLFSGTNTDAISNTNDMNNNEENKNIANTETNENKEDNTLSQSSEEKSSNKQEDNETPSNENIEAQKSKGGRPPKNGLKSAQFSVTMNPIKYEQLKVVAEERCRGNFSQLIDDAVQIYCKENNINLNSITISDATIEKYLNKQNKKQKKNSN